MSAWKSRWSWVRLVNSATSKWIASARCSASACEETSIAQARSPPVEHPPEGRLQVDRLRRRPLDLLLDPADDLLHRAQQPARDPGRLEDLADQERRRRLAVGPGHPDDPQLRRRVAPEARRQRRHRRPRVGDHDLRRPSSSSSRSTTSAAAPASTAAGANSCPSTFSPARRRTASRARPCGCRRRAPAISTPGSPTTRSDLGSSASSSVQSSSRRDSR